MHGYGRDLRRTEQKHATEQNPLSTPDVSGIRAVCRQVPAGCQPPWVWNFLRPFSHLTYALAAYYADIPADPD